jgi:ubiquinone/menaquinone biosynthesis C-methylase UbiE
MKYDRKFYEKQVAIPTPCWQARGSRILQELDLTPNDSVLDAGCGVGYYLHKISPLVSGVCVGVDLSSKAVRLANKQRTNGNTTWILGSIEHLPFRDEVFSRILCDNVIEHVPKYRDAIFEVARVLKTDGKLLMTTPNKQMYFPFEVIVRWWIDPKAGHLWRFSYGALKHFLEEAGLSVDKVHYHDHIFGILHLAISYAISKMYTEPYDQRVWQRAAHLLNILNMLNERFNNPRLVHFHLIATKHEI